MPWTPLNTRPKCSEGGPPDGSGGGGSGSGTGDPTNPAGNAHPGGGGSGSNTRRGPPVQVVAIPFHLHHHLQVQPLPNDTSRAPPCGSMGTVGQVQKTLPKLLLPSNYKDTQRCLKFGMTSPRYLARRCSKILAYSSSRARSKQTWSMVAKSPAQRATLEPAYISGTASYSRASIYSRRSKAYSRSSQCFALNSWKSFQSPGRACMRHGYCTAELMVWYVMKQLILPPDVNEVTMQKEILTPPKVPPAPLDQASTWLEDAASIESMHQDQAECASKDHSSIRQTWSVTQYYRTIGNIWDNLYSEHQLRDSNITLDRVYTCLQILIELKLNEEQVNITQIATGSNGLRSTQWWRIHPCSKGKVPSKGKGKGEKVKAESLIGVHRAMTTGSLTVAHKDTIVQGTIQGDSQDDVHLWLYSPLCFSMHTFSQAQSQECRVGCTAWQQEESNGKSSRGRPKSMKLPRARKEKVRGRSRKASPRERAHRDRSCTPRPSQIQPSRSDRPQPKAKPEAPLVRPMTSSSYVSTKSKPTWNTPMGKAQTTWSAQLPNLKKSFQSSSPANGHSSRQSNIPLWTRCQEYEELHIALRHGRAVWYSRQTMVWRNVVSCKKSMSTRSNPLSPMTPFQLQQTMTSNKDIVNQSCASPSHKFEIQCMHYLIVELLTCYFQDTCFQKELDPSKWQSV